jgi:uncharacterized protein GlcG (DUF336 family)
MWHGSKRNCAVAAVAIAPMVFLANMAGACGLTNSVVGRVLGQLKTVANLSDGNGGIFSPNQVWVAIVDRAGVLCNAAKTGDAWPAGRTASISAATTANGFSNASVAFSTANLYAPTQPGGYFFGAGGANPFNPAFQAPGTGIGQTPGGASFIGGGVALYLRGTVIGGLGVSGDSSCADHAIAFRMRKLAGYDGIPGGAAPDGTDNIIYAPVGATPTGFAHPHCFPSDLTPAQIENIPAN